MTATYSLQSLAIPAETILYLGFLLQRQIWRLPQKSLDFSEAYRCHLNISGLRYAEQSISVHRETVE